MTHYKNMIIIYIEIVCICVYANVVKMT